MDNWKDHQKAHIQEAIDTHCHQHHHLDKYTHLLNMDNDSHNCHSSKVCRSLFVDIHLCHFRQDTSWTLAHKIQGNGLHIQAHKGLLGYIFRLLGIPKTTKKFDAEALPSFDDFTLVSTGPLQIISSFLQWRGQNPLHFFLGFDGLLYFFLMQSSLIHWSSPCKGKLHKSSDFLQFGTFNFGQVFEAKTSKPNKIKSRRIRSMVILKCFWYK